MPHYNKDRVAVLVLVLVLAPVLAKALAWVPDLVLVAMEYKSLAPGRSDWDQ
jgi:hypothetical protein